MTQATEVLSPTSADEAVAQFGDGSGVTVIGGGTIVVPEITYGRRSPTKALLLGRAGLDTLSFDGATVTVGAGLPVHRLSELAQDVEALAQCALNVADYEIRRQGTVGGNVCAGAAGRRTAWRPAGPLPGARGDGALGRRRRRDERAAGDLPGTREDRLLLELAFEKPGASAFAALEYPHTHEYTVLAVTGVRTQGGETRLAATGVAGHGTRLASAEAAASDPEAAGKASLGDVTLGDDALASAWYRERALPVLVRRVLAKLGEAA